MRFQTQQRIVFIGDSITDCGRRDTDAPYGNGYMSLVRAFTVARYPQLRLTWVNRGVGGNTVRISPCGGNRTRYGPGRTGSA